MSDITHIRTELQQLIAQEEDVDILQAIHTLLRRTQPDAIIKEKLTKRAIRAEEDIQAGRLFSREEAVTRTNRKPQS